jgi:hypothetical protein
VNEAVNKPSVSLLLFPAILLLSLGIACIASAGRVEEQVCDVGADYFLGVEDYSEAIRLHIKVVRMHPDNALAHDHLGVALMHFRAPADARDMSIRSENRVSEHGFATVAPKG